MTLQAINGSIKKVRDQLHPESQLPQRIWQKFTLSGYFLSASAGGVDNELTTLLLTIPYAPADEWYTPAAVTQIKVPITILCATL